MTHNIRKTLGSLNGEKRRVVSTVYGELGSGLLDKNGREIFEGDKVEFYITENETCTDTIVFRDGGFFVLDVLVNDIDALDIEVVGHADD